MESEHQGEVALGKGGLDEESRVAELPQADEDVNETQQRVIELLVELSRSGVAPNEVSIRTPDLTEDEVRFDDGSWWTALVSVQDYSSGWIRQSRPEEQSRAG